MPQKRRKFDDDFKDGAVGPVGLVVLPASSPAADFFVHAAGCARAGDRRGVRWRVRIHADLSGGATRVGSAERELGRPAHAGAGPGGREAAAAPVVDPARPYGGEVREPDPAGLQPAGPERDLVR
jgi:hypothetical protein